MDQKKPNKVVGNDDSGDMAGWFDVDVKDNLQRQDGESAVKDCDLPVGDNDGRVTRSGISHPLCHHYECERFCALRCFD